MINLRRESSGHKLIFLSFLRPFLHLFCVRCQAVWYLYQIRLNIHTKQVQSYRLDAYLDHNSISSMEESYLGSGLKIYHRGRSVFGRAWMSRQIDEPLCNFVCFLWGKEPCYAVEEGDNDVYLMVLDNKNRFICCIVLSYVSYSLNTLCCWMTWTYNNYYIFLDENSTKF